MTDNLDEIERKAQELRSCSLLKKSNVGIYSIDKDALVDVKNKLEELQGLISESDLPTEIKNGIKQQVSQLQDRVNETISKLPNVPEKYPYPSEESKLRYPEDKEDKYPRTESDRDYTGKFRIKGATPEDLARFNEVQEQRRRDKYPYAEESKTFMTPHEILEASKPEKYPYPEKYPKEKELEEPSEEKKTNAFNPQEVPEQKNMSNMLEETVDPTSLLRKQLTKAFYDAMTKATPLPSTLLFKARPEDLRDCEREARNIVKSSSIVLKTYDGQIPRHVTLENVGNMSWEAIHRLAKIVEEARRQGRLP